MLRKRSDCRGRAGHRNGKITSLLYAAVLLLGREKGLRSKFPKSGKKDRRIVPDGTGTLGKRCRSGSLRKKLHNSVHHAQASKCPAKDQEGTQGNRTKSEQSKNQTRPVLQAHSRRGEAKTGRA